MKIDALHITDAEMEIMKVLWRIEKPVTVVEIGLLLPERQWKRSTIHTLAIHLADKGMIEYYNGGGTNYYMPYITESDYIFIMTKLFLEKMYEGNMLEMVRTLLSDMDLTEEMLTALKELVNEAELPSVIWERYAEGEAVKEVEDNTRVSTEAEHDIDNKIDKDSTDTDAQPFYDSVVLYFYVLPSKPVMYDYSGVMFLDSA